MASITDNDGNGSDDSVFYDANSDAFDDHEIKTPAHNEPRWRVSSNQEHIKPPENFATFILTDSHFKDIERRDKLHRLRNQETKYSHTFSPSHKSISTATKYESISGSEASTPDLIKDHLDHEHNARRIQTPTSFKSKTGRINSDVSPNIRYQHDHSSAYASNAKSAHHITDHQSIMKQASESAEPNFMDLNLIDRITRFGELSATGLKLDDDEILQQPIVRNLDSGKYVPFNDVNPMTQTIMERAHINITNSTSSHRTSVLRNHQSRTKSNPNDSRSNKELNRDDNASSSSESVSTKSSCTTGVSSSSNASKSSKSKTERSGNSFFQGRKKQLRKLVARNFLSKGAKKRTNENKEPIDADDDEEEIPERIPINDGSNGDLKYKASRSIKDHTQFDRTQLLQTIDKAHDGSIWCIKFSPDGHLLATGGQDNALKVWVLRVSQRYFVDFCREANGASKQQNEILGKRFQEFYDNFSTDSLPPTVNGKLGLTENQAPLYPKPFCELVGHHAPVLDVVWSKSLFLLSSSMDKSVRLWHLSRSECLCFFRHVDFVFAIAFYPRDDRFFVSASLDGHVRVWNIPDKRVIYWTLIPAQASKQISAAQANLITAINFCDDGQKINVGTFDGRFLVYSNSLRYDTVMNIGDKESSRSHRSRKTRRKTCKITGIEPMNGNSYKVLITSNDSRIRLYDTRTKEIEHKYRGYSNQSSQIRGSFSYDDQYVISGSEDCWIYIWKTEPNYYHSINGANPSPVNASKLNKSKSRNFDRAFERIQVHNCMVTCAIFAPNATAIMQHLYGTNNPIIASSSTSQLSSSILRNSIDTQSRSESVHSNEVASSNVNNARTSYFNNPTTSNALDGSLGPTYVIVTADSKGQLKLLVNRFYR